MQQQRKEDAKRKSFRVCVCGGGGEGDMQNDDNERELK
jgi:hypothetical protein